MEGENHQALSEQPINRPKKWLWIILGAVLLLLVVAIALKVTGVGFGEKDDSPPPQFIQADFIDLKYIFSISKFRSGSGHDFSGQGETCRSMKHYFNVQWSPEVERERTENNGFPKPPSPGKGIDIFSPVDGEIVSVGEERTPIGKQVYIRPDSAKGYTVRLFHVYLLPGFGKGTKVQSGQPIGQIGLNQNTDIAITRGSKFNEELISYFSVMPDNIFANYQERGAKERNDFIITKEERDAQPLQCNGEQFAINYDSTEPDKHFVYLSGYIDPRQAANEQRNQAEAKKEEQPKATAQSPAQSNPVSNSSSNQSSSQSSQSAAQSAPAESTPAPETPVPQARPVLYLPVSGSPKPDGIMPMGETLFHSLPYGHPGIDFQWDNPDSLPSIIASMDATVTEIRAGTNHVGTWDVATENGRYGVDYTEMSSVREGLKVGEAVKAGDVIGYPQHPAAVTDKPNFRMIHWEFGYVSEGTNQNFIDGRLCPLTYFSASAKSSLETWWANTNWPEMKANAPDICSNYYAGKDS
ncbi:MAG: hypothetical protein WCT32_02090 [Patescibacteria group bacterium]|jgi:murein DD-endopeptidase MepM/ murein hydrolase activator NlpD